MFFYYTVHIILFLILALPKYRTSLEIPAVHMGNADLLKNVRMYGGVYRENMNECMSVVIWWSAVSVSKYFAYVIKELKVEGKNVSLIVFIYSGIFCALYFKS